MRNVIIPAEDELVERAEAAAHARGTTLADAGKEWLRTMTSRSSAEARPWGTRDETLTPEQRLAEWDALMKSLAHVTSTGPYTRDEVNER